MERLTDSLDWFTHGWHAFVGAWLVVLVGMWAGLWLRGANKGRFLTASIAAAVVALLAMLAAAALKTGLDAAGIAGPLRAYGTFAIFPLFGLLAGLLSIGPDVPPPFSSRNVWSLTNGDFGPPRRHDDAARGSRGR